MSTTQSHTARDASSATLPRVPQLRLRGETVIPLSHGKYSIGSGPRCDLRLREPGVGPLHCLIVHNADGLRVRRWSTDTLLNGLPFNEADLAAGDLLSVGPLDLEVVLPMAEVPADVDEPAAPTLSQNSEDIDWQGAMPYADEPQYEDEPVEEEIPFTDSTLANEYAAIDHSADGQSPELLDVLSFNWAAFDELVERVNELKEKVESALADRNVGSADESPAVDAEHQIGHDTSMDLPVDIAGSDVTMRSLLEELATTRLQLAEQEVELTAARDSIESLESKLAESQIVWEHVETERAKWRVQIADLESLLSEHVARIEVLESRLEQARIETANRLAAADVEEVVDRAYGNHDGAATDGPSHIGCDLKDDCAQPAFTGDESEWSDLLPPTAATGHLPFDAEFDPDQVTEVEELDSNGSSADDDDGAIESEQLPASADDEFNWNSQPERAVLDECDVDPDRWTEDVDSPNSHDLASETSWSSNESGEGEDEVPVQESADTWALDNERNQDREAAEEPVATEKVAIDDGFSFVEAAGEETLPVLDKSAPLSRLSEDDAENMGHLQGMSIWRQEARKSAEAVPGKVPTPLRFDASRSVVESHDESTIADAKLSPVGEPTDTAALAHLAGDVSAEVEPNVELPLKTVPDLATSDPPATSAGPQTASFIDRYAHMFEADAAESGLESPPSAPEVGNVNLDTRDTSKSATPAPVTASSDDEESIEQYIAKLMSRIRGNSSDELASKGAPTSVQHSQLSAGSGVQVGRERESQAAATGDADACDLPAQPQPPLINLSEIKRKGHAPEIGTDMEALRALANQSARHAISVHQVRTLRRNAVTRFIITLLAATTSLYLFLNGDGWQTLEFATACVALLVSLVWSRITFATLIQAIQVGAFDNMQRDFAPVEDGDAPLPIDVE